MEKTIVEYRGVENAVYAEVLKDTLDAFETGEVKPLAGLSEIGKKTNSSSAVHYYDNVPAISINSTGADEVVANTSAIPIETLADITGQYYDEETGMLVEGEREQKYYALGYITKKTDGTKVYVWRLKGTFSIPDSTHKTEDDGTDAEGQQVTYTGISTIHKFTKTGKPGKAVNVDTGKELADVTEFFLKVQTPDTVKAKATVISDETPAA